MLLSMLAVVVGLALLVWSADRFVLGAAGLARAAGLSPLIIGMTVVGFGTSSPELAVSALASWQGNSGLAVGNAVGSNIANVGLILGICALIQPLSVQSGILRRELPMATAASLLLLLLVIDGTLGRVDGAILAAGLVAFLAWSIRSARRGGDDALATELAGEMPPPVPAGRSILWIAVGLVFLVGSSQLLIWGAVNIAQAMGVSDLVIGLTIVAIGTSLPELAASVAGLLKKEDDIAIGNILGSNLFNILAILLAPALIDPGPIPDPMLLWRDIPIMIGLMLMLWATAYGLRGKPLRLERIDGALLLSVYVGYTLILLYSAVSESPWTPTN